MTPLDIAHLIELFGRLGPVRSGTAEDAVRLRLIAIAIDGLRAGPATEALPGPAPSAAHYEGRWATRR